MSAPSSAGLKRESPEDTQAEERTPKKLKTDDAKPRDSRSSLVKTEDDAVIEAASPAVTQDVEADAVMPSPDSELKESDEEQGTILPPSHKLLGIPSPETTGANGLQITESDVGISEYIGRDVPPIQGIIKQRFTDFLVYEVDLDGQVIRIKSLDRPESSSRKKSDDSASVQDALEDSSDIGKAEITVADQVKHAPGSNIAFAIPPTDAQASAGDAQSQEASPQDQEPWPERFSESLKPFLSDAAILSVRQMFLEGRELPRVSDSGWGGRQTHLSNSEDQTAAGDTADAHGGLSARGNDRRGRGGRRGARGGSGGRQGSRREDTRKVISDPISSKETRTQLHQVVRTLFGGKLETETDNAGPSGADGSRIVIKWSRAGNARGGRGGRDGGAERLPRGTFPDYIHFTMQKTNRDTQDALAHLSRTLHVNVKDLAVAGTKDKRGVTVQRVSLRRGKKTVEDIWRHANGQPGRKTLQEALSQRGDRGIRLADFNYRKAPLDLGMLKGNAFVITLRNVQVDSIDTIDRAMNTMKEKGFINYYGMQRFGTASIPTHSIGLALLHSDWHRAISFILRKRPGEHPDVNEARDAWLVDGDLEKALSLMPRRVVAERCILESYQKQKGDTRNAMGALSTIPKNLRLMYVHAYQSYVWNAIVSERIRSFGSDKPIVGDMVFAAEDAELIAVDETAPAQETNAGDEEPDLSSAKTKNKARKAWHRARVKTLTEDDVNDYSIFDVIMPLPGKDVDFPGGELGERYRAFLIADGLDPDNFVRKQREYTLNGSYRKILHLPKDLSWSIMRYTDPDVALAQADEDSLLGFDPPVIDENGKFLALQVKMQLGTAAYATMALREVTKTETSSYFQTTLTQASEDQKFKGGSDLTRKSRSASPEVV